jgi:Fe2+ or Zn2+ uptake regulation protein
MLQETPCEKEPARRTRNTGQRKAVLKAVQTLDGKHPTAMDVFEQVRSDYPCMSLATVYRALHALVEQKALVEMRVENVARYDAGPCPHHHVVCKRCGAVRDVCVEVCPEALPISTLHVLQEMTGFALDAHPLQLSGLCPQCQ